MFNLERGDFPLRIGTALAAALLPLGVATAASAQTSDSSCPSTPTWAECRAAWDDSSAQETCVLPEIYVAGSKCRLNAWCYTGENEAARDWTDIEACVGDIDNLSNCSGSFRVGSC